MHHLGPGGAVEARGGASSQGGLVIPPVFSAHHRTLAAEGKNAPQMIW